MSSHILHPMFRKAELLMNHINLIHSMIKNPDIFLGRHILYMLTCPLNGPTKIQASDLVNPYSKLAKMVPESEKMVSVPIQM